MEKFTQLFSMFPFLLATGQKGFKMNSLRLVELIVMAATSGGVIYGVMTTQITGLRDDLKRIEVSVRENRTETREEIQFLQSEFRDVKRDLYSPNGSRDSWGTRSERTIRR